MGPLFLKYTTSRVLSRTNTNDTCECGGEKGSRNILHVIPPQISNTNHAVHTNMDSHIPKYTRHAAHTQVNKCRGKIQTKT